ncbi:MAG: hypothetical protein ABI655_11680 [Phenylobacterium sp.]
MRKSLAAVMAAITFGGAVAATALPAQAQRYERHYSRERHHGNDAAGAAIAAGVLGLALGAAITSNRSNSYGPYGPYYDRGYSARGYYEPSYRVCESRRWEWDPYIGRRVLVRSRYAC